MKSHLRPVILIAVSLVIALFSAAVTYTAKISGLEYSTTTAFLLQTTPTPQVEEADNSEIGSTDPIIIMGGVITAIVLIPILAQRKAWSDTE